MTISQRDPVSAAPSGWIGLICFTAVLLLSGCRSDVAGIPSTVLPDHTPRWVEVKGDETQSSHLQVFPSSVLVTTTIQFDLPGDAIVSLTIYDDGGEGIAKLLDRERLKAGVYEASFDASSLASGFYVFTLVARFSSPEGGSSSSILTYSKKMLLIK